MKTEYICIVTMDECDVRLSASNGGKEIEHPLGAYPCKTIFRLTNEARAQLVKSAAPQESAQ